jgi:hypothetical protein
MERAESRRMPSEQRRRFKQKAPAFHHDVIGHTACTAAGSSSGKPDRALRFLARLDRHLPTLADQAARRDFLDRQIEGWQRRYARFITTEGDSEPILIPTDPPQAADFLLTIDGAPIRAGSADEGSCLSETQICLSPPRSSRSWSQPTSAAPQPSGKPIFSIMLDWASIRNRR